MTFFVDANVLIYSVVDCDEQANCFAVLEAIGAGEIPGRTSGAVLEEVWHVERRDRPGGLDGLAHYAHQLFRPLLAVDDAAFDTAFSVTADRLGTNDRLHVGTCAAHGIERILSADRGFDQVSALTRIDPGDDRAIAELLRGD